MLLHQPDDLVFGAVAGIRANVEHLALYLIQWHLQCQADGITHIPHVNEGAGISSLVNDQLTLRKRFQHKLVDDQIKAGPGQDTKQSSEAIDN